MEKEIVKNNLKLQAFEKDTYLKIRWLGKSMDRNPAEYLSPFLNDAVAFSEKENRNIVMDFTELNYMNSSTITPIVQMLDDVKMKGLNLTILYSRSKSWQEVNFKALRFFESTKPIIKILAV